MRLTRHRKSANHGAAILPAPVAQRWTWPAVVFALALIFLLDRATALAPVQHLYYIPIILASVRYGFRGSAVSAAAIVLYHLANPRVITFRYEESDFLQIALFVAVGITAAKLSNDRRRLHQLAISDDLTGLHNLRSFEAHLRVLMRNSARTALPIALLVLDLDRLKSLNDTHGHLAGAEAVRTVGHAIADHLPDGAVACRYGGDEFVVALPGCDEAHARAIADGLRLAVNSMAPVLAGVTFPQGALSISVGIACSVPASLPRGTTPLRHGRGQARAPRSVEPFGGDDEVAGETLFRAADKALYSAKTGGRNRVFVAPLDSSATDALPATAGTPLNGA
jgi:diguanylate cyclase (GGDEF)-like protein